MAMVGRLVEKNIMGSVLKNLGAGLILSVAATQFLGAAIPTNTTLTVLPGSIVTSGTIVTFTATVSGAGPVTKGTIKFCNPTFVRCDPNSGLYGAAQLSTSGTARLSTQLGVGVNNIKAVFVPTTTHDGSESQIETLEVDAAPIYASETMLTVTGSPNNYNLIGTVTGLGDQMLTGTIHLFDISNGNSELNSTLLGLPSWTLTAVANTSQIFAQYGIPVAVAVGDFNGDGKLDLVTANDDDHGLIAVQLGNGDGSFQPSISSAAGADPLAIAVGDFDGDGRLDVAVANSNDNDVSILLGNGHGTFRPAGVVATGLAPNSIAVGDFNSDGQLDLAVVNNHSNSISILLGNGDGTFQAQTIYSVGSQPTAICAGDFNGDGRIDLVVANGASNNLEVLLGNGDGTLQSPVFYATGSYPSAVSVGDLNRDGNTDLVVANLDSNDVSVLMGKGDGTFATQVTYGADSLPVSMSVADFDGDGNLDIVAASVADGGALSILLGAGDGTFHGALKYASASGPDSLDSVAVGDFNGDGNIDIASAFGLDARILLGEQVATFNLNGVRVTGTGMQNVQAVFSGDSSRSGSQSNIVMLQGLTASAIRLASSLSSPLLGQTVSLTAKVTPGATGLVSFTAGSTLLGTAPIDSSGTAVFSTTFPEFSAGGYLVTATYLGDSSFAASTASITVTLSASSTTLLLSSSANPSLYGGLVVLRAVLSPGATGTVTFMEGSIVLGVKAVNGGVGSLEISSLPAGDHVISAIYGGDTNYARSTSAPINQIVNKTAAAVVLTSSANPSVYGSNLTLTASLTPGTTGTVTFADGSTVIGVASVEASGVAKISYTSLTAGSHTIAGTYS
jgi:hypothetical protein